jgi:DNA-binding NarL/FixJ family response regulator
MNEHLSRVLKHRAGPVLCITPWERNALQFLADGHTVSELSRRVDSSASEVGSLLEELFAAMGAANQSDAIAVAYKRGLLRPGPIRLASAIRHETAVI